MQKQAEWILCPVCGNKTRDRIREDTVLKNYPLDCPKCKQETLIEAENLNVTIIHSGKNEPHSVGTSLRETPRPRPPASPCTCRRR